MQLLSSKHVREIDSAIRTMQHARSIGGRVTVEMSENTAILFLDFLRSLDPDMPPPPVCKALGPLVGDVMMNAKLARVDAVISELNGLVDRLGRAWVLYEKAFRQPRQAQKPTPRKPWGYK